LLIGSSWGLFLLPAAEIESLEKIKTNLHFIIFKNLNKDQVKNFQVE